MKRLLLFKKPMSYIAGQTKWGSRSVIGNKLLRIPGGVTPRTNLFEGQLFSSGGQWTSDGIGEWDDIWTFDGTASNSMGVNLTGLIIGNTYQFVADVQALSGQLDVRLTDTANVLFATTTGANITAEKVLATNGGLITGWRGTNGRTCTITNLRLYDLGVA